MKKVMFAAAAVAGLVAMGDGIESANVVGYQKTDMVNPYGYNFIAPTFKDVTAGTATYDLQSIKLVGSMVGDGLSDFIEIWDAAGAMTDVQYYYVTEAMGADHDGWVVGMMGSEFVEDVTLDLGTGLYLYIGSGDDVQVQYAGEVKAGDVVSPALPFGYNIAGNATPLPVNLQQIQLLGSMVGDGLSDFIEVWDATGSMTDVQYYYVTAAMGADHDGWVAGMLGTDYPDDVIYAPGQAFFLYVGSADDVQVKLPAALAE